MARRVSGIKSEKHRVNKIKRRLELKTDRCNCAVCNYTRKIRRRRTRKFRDEEEIDWALKCLKLYHDGGRDKWFEVMYSAIKYVEGTTWRHLPSASARKFTDMFSLVNFDKAFNENARFTPTEREPDAPEITAIFDHTFIECANTNGMYWGGHHKAYGLKFLIVITPQGSIIRVVGPIVARITDFTHCKLPEVGGAPVVNHFENDVFLADSGYQGSFEKHVFVPIKKNQGVLNSNTNLKERTEEQQQYNKRLDRFRARVEHSIGCMKQRFTLFSKRSIVQRDKVVDGRRVQDDFLIGCFFKLACLLHSRQCILSNRKYPKYATCNSSFWQKKVSRVPKHLPPLLPKGDPCTCDCFPRKGYAEVYDTLFDTMIANGEQLPFDKFEEKS